MYLLSSGAHVSYDGNSTPILLIEPLLLGAMTNIKQSLVEANSPFKITDPLVSVTYVYPFCFSFATKLLTVPSIGMPLNFRCSCVSCADIPMAMQANISIEMILFMMFRM